MTSTATDAANSSPKESYQQNLQTWWNQVRQSETPPSPYDCVVQMFGLQQQPESVEEICWIAMRNASKKSPPRTVASLLQSCAHVYKPDGKDKAKDNKREAHLRNLFGHVSCRPKTGYDAEDEEELLALLDAIPDSEDKITFIFMDTMIQICDPANPECPEDTIHSRKYLDAYYGRSMLKFSPDGFFGHSLDFPSTKSSAAHEYVLSRLRGGESKSETWCKEDMMFFLRVLLTKQNKMRKLRFLCPNRMVESHSSGEQMNPESLLPVIDQLENAEGYCGIVDLEVVQENGYGNFRMGLPILHAMTRMPKLEKLTLRPNRYSEYSGKRPVSKSRLSQAIPFVRMMLQRSNFHSLVLHLDIRDTNDDDKLQLESLFEVLHREASYLKNLKFSGIYGGDGPPYDQVLEICKQNISLLHVEFCDEWGCKRENHEKKDRIDYYTMLNRYGRGKIRDQLTTLPEAINLFCAILENKDRYFEEHDAENNMYEGDENDEESNESGENDDGESNVSERNGDNSLAEDSSEGESTDSDPVDDDCTSNDWLHNNIEPIYQFVHESPAILAYFATYLASNDSEIANKSRLRKRRRIV